MIVKVLFKNNSQEVTGYLNSNEKTLEVSYIYNLEDNENDPRRSVSSDGSITTFDSGGLYFDKESIIEAKIYSEESGFKGTLIGLNVVQSSHKGLMHDRTVQKMKYSYMITGACTTYEECVFDSVRFSFNRHSENLPRENSSFFEASKDKTTVNTGESIVWTADLDEGKTLSLYDSLKSRSDSIIPAFDRSAIFEITSKTEKMNFKMILEYIDKVKQLLSIASLSNETIKNVVVYEGKCSYKVDMPKEVATVFSSQCFIEYQDITPDYYIKWILNIDKIKPYPSILLDSFEHKDENSIRLLLSSLLSLSDRMLNGDTAGDDGKKITRIICYTDQSISQTLIGTKFNCVDLGRRLRDGRTYWMHNTLENEMNSTSLAEMRSHLVLIRYIYILSFFQYCGIKVKKHITPSWIAQNRYIAKNYGKCGKLNDIKAKSTQYQSQKFKNNL